MAILRFATVLLFSLLWMTGTPVMAGQQAPKQAYFAGLAAETGMKEKKIARKYQRLERLLDRQEKRQQRKKGSGVKAGFIVAGLVAVGIAIAVFFVFESLLLTIIVGLAALGLFILAFVEIEEDSRNPNRQRR